MGKAAAAACYHLHEGLWSKFGTHLRERRNCSSHTSKWQEKPAAEWRSISTVQVGGWDGMRRGTDSGPMRISVTSLQLVRPAFNQASNKYGLSVATNEAFPEETESLRKLLFSLPAIFTNVSTRLYWCECYQCVY